MSGIENYDFFCVDFSKRILDAVTPMVAEKEARYSEVENIVTKSLGVLQENGLYAFLLYLVWRENNGTKGERRVAGAINEHIIGRPGDQTLLRLNEIGLPLSEADHPLDVGRKLCESLDDLFFARDLIERTLTYVRYNAKGLKEEGPEEPQKELQSEA
ncbi:MAG: hypothetical protein ACUVXI_14725 [bacterium]